MNKRSKDYKYRTLYNSWRSMKDRCYSKNQCKYKYYGAKGIEVCEEWKHFVKFMEWALNNGWQIGLTIDRINPKLNYCPKNCQWLSRSDNTKKEWADKRIICVR